MHLGKDFSFSIRPDGGSADLGTRRLESLTCIVHVSSETYAAQFRAIHGKSGEASVVD
jgi:hypothetical protein